MREIRRRWILGLLCIDPDDRRLLVPLPLKLGLAVNFGNPRVVPLLCWIAVLLFLGLLIAPIAAHPSSLVRNPTPQLWMLTSCLAALVLVRWNACFSWSDYRHLPLASYGLVAASVGFGLQAIVNGPLVLWWGIRDLLPVQCLVLATVGAVAQTFGKGAAIALLWKVRPASSRIDLIRQGLLVGLGFTLCEITYLFFLAAWAQAPVPPLSLWERASVSVFHIYSAGLVALALGSKRHRLIALVVAIHALMDHLALIGGMQQWWSSPWSLCTLEATFSVLALCTWGTFLLVARGANGRPLLDAGTQAGVAPDTPSPRR